MPPEPSPGQPPAQSRPVPPKGTLRTWNDDRGYGFIAPRDGGRELFVHISAFPRDGSRPTVGETLTYELGRGRDGKPAATTVFREAIGRPAEAPRARRDERRARRKSVVPAALGIVLIVAGAAWGYRTYQARAMAPPASPAEARADTPAATAAADASFRCDGRTHCAQMTSCAEATYFLQHCPGTQMDGNHDGVPCEQQWCNGASSK